MTNFWRPSVILRGCHLHPWPRGGSNEHLATSPSDTLEVQRSSEWPTPELNQSQVSCFHETMFTNTIKVKATQTRTQENTVTPSVTKLLSLLMLGSFTQKKNITMAIKCYNIPTSNKSPTWWHTSSHKTPVCLDQEEGHTWCGLDPPRLGGWSDMAH